jgi:hypothetical protein
MVAKKESELKYLWEIRGFFIEYIMQLTRYSG